jgi:type II secretory pathway component PulF
VAVGEHERGLLSDLEEQALAEIERRLIHDDRRLARLLGNPLRISAPVVMICIGVTILLVGCMMLSPVLLLGLALTAFGMCTVPLRVA